MLARLNSWILATSSDFYFALKSKLWGESLALVTSGLLWSILILIRSIFITPHNTIFFTLFGVRLALFLHSKIILATLPDSLLILLQIQLLIQTLSVIHTVIGINHIFFVLLQVLVNVHILIKLQFFLQFLDPWLQVLNFLSQLLILLLMMLFFFLLDFVWLVLILL